MARKRYSTRRSPKDHPRGILSMTAAGYGFVDTAEGSFFVPASKTKGAFDGDMVEVSVCHGSQRKKRKDQLSNRPGDKPTASVIRVIQRAHETIVGRYEVADPFGVVIPQDHRIPYDIFTMRSDYPDIPDGSMVRVRISQYPSRNSAATGIIEDVLGDCDDENMDIEVVIGRLQLEAKFSDATLEQVENACVDEDRAISQGYADLRDRFIFTIDPEDARDFDDAISLDPIGDDKWRLGVHIADVSHYVTWGSSVDLDARRRATSVYLVDRVIPMLPEKLSGDICSLVPGKPRRCMTMDAIIDADGRVMSSEFYPSIIESKARLSYDQALCYMESSLSGNSWQDAAQHAKNLPVPYGSIEIDDQIQSHLFDALSQLNKIAKMRTKMRFEAGGIDFDTVEAKVKLDDEGYPIGVVLRSKNDATAAIEEAMLLTNECAARKLRNQSIPGVFRVHEQPTIDALSSIVPILQEFDYAKEISIEEFVHGNHQAIQAVLAKAEGNPEAPLVTQLVLRAMQRAMYSPNCDPHYALASEAYCHFTSPIRRYPDLIVHRMIKTSLFFGKGETYTAQVDSIPWLAEHSSKMERIAEQAARETQELKLVEYMQRYVGMVMPGIVCGVAMNGLYVQLENTAEGLIPVRELGHEYFSFDPALHTLNGQETGKTYRLGQKIRVVVAAAPLHQRRLELRLP